MEIIDALNVARQIPCDKCPFNRACPPGALGGSPPEVYIGQAEAGFIVPCHKTIDYADPAWKVKALECPQCAGYSIYRANNALGPGLAVRRPGWVGPMELPPNHEAVFSSHVEFYTHHMGISIEHAKEYLDNIKPVELARWQMSLSSVQVRGVKRKDDGK
jgi:hypothetical protein